MNRKLQPSPNLERISRFDLKDSVSTRRSSGSFQLAVVRYSIRTQKKLFRSSSGRLRSVRY